MCLNDLYYLKINNKIIPCKCALYYVFFYEASIDYYYFNVNVNVNANVNVKKFQGWCATRTNVLKLTLSAVQGTAKTIKD